jgi:hypothetical protein
MSATNKSFNYVNSETHQNGGKKITRKVLIKRGKGDKSVKYYKNGKLMLTVKRKLKPIEISLIKIGKFIPGLFKDCGCNKTRKHKM